MSKSQLYITLIIVVVAIYIAGGCTTTDSDMPWNTPETWEGSPAIPGMSPDY